MPGGRHERPDNEEETVDGQQTRYTVISLFSGSLGLDIGLQATGRFRHLACVEMDPAACETIRVNRDAGRVDPGRLYEADIVRLDPRRVMRDLGLRPGELDLLAGGPPCQSYSFAGKRGGVQDARGLMLWQYLWFVEAMRPKAWILENVTGLLSARLTDADEKGSLLRRFLRDLPADYRADVFTVNAADHGVTQLRERVLIIGNRLSRTAEFPAATHGPAGSGLLPHRTLRDAVEGLVDPDPVVMPFSPVCRRVMPLVPAGGNWRNLPPEVARGTMGKSFFIRGTRRGWFRRLSWDRPSPTILTAPNRAMTLMAHPDDDRPLSLGECARVQGYPDDFEFAGTPAERFTQVGNAVPPELGRAAGLAAAGLLDGGPPAEGLERFRFFDLAHATRLRKKAMPK
jgi:DNA (cytosine-5)-methyltransferase 1